MSFVKCCFESTEGHDFLDSFVQKCTDPGCKYFYQFLLIFLNNFLIKLGESIACGTRIFVLLNLILAHATLVID